MKETRNQGSSTAKSVIAPGLIKILTALIAVAVLCGCGTVRHETALEWMQKQPNYIDP
jgi:hypothetical protein